MVTPFHVKYAPGRNAPAEPSPPPRELVRFQDLLRRLFQFDCADLDFGIYRIMNHKREAVDGYIDRDLPGAIEKAVGDGSIATEAERARVFEETRDQMIEIFGEDCIAPSGELVKYQETPFGMKYMLWRERARHSESAGDVRRGIYNHLYSFFSRYYQDGDFMPKRRYSWEHPYVVPYNGEEVHFHWANRDQYYVKSAEHFTDYRYRTGSGVSVRFSVRSAHVEQNDVKGRTRFFFPRLSDAVWDPERRELDVPFDHRLPTGTEAKDLKKNGQQTTILERAEATVAEALSSSPEAAKALLDSRDGHTGEGDAPSLFMHHAQRFARKRTSDFFIHRDLKAFLGRELDHYLRSEVLGLRSLVAGGEARADAWLDKMRIIRDVGASVIEFLAQIEGFQRMLWEKRKFVVDVQYCVAVRLVPDELLPRVLECEALWEEWRALGCAGDDDTLFIGDGPDARREFLESNPGLLLDTRHFDAGFAERLLGALDDIDAKMNGVLVWSENWQALNLLQERYRQALSSVYIDPPYNTDASAILYKNDYKDSSWLSLMADRLALSRRLLGPDGILGCAIDDEEVSRLRMLMPEVLPRELGTVVVRSNPAGRKSRGQLSPSHEFALFFGHDRAAPGSLRKTEQELARYRFEDEVGRYDWNNLIRHGSNDRREDRPKLFFPIYVSKDDQIRVPRLQWLADQQRYDVLEHPREDEVELLPVRIAEGEGAIEKNWHHGPDRIRDNPQQYRVRRKDDAINIDFMIRMDMKAIPKTWWGDPRYASSNRGPRTSKDLFGGKPFDYPKAVGLVEDCLRVSGLDGDSTTLDYFAGSGTTGHAVINLNREDGGRRKFILVEMGDHFDTVLMPRLKKIAFSPEWKNGRAVRPATPEEAERGPRIIKYFRLESYEDALNNIEFREPDADLFGLDDYMLRYMLKWETKESATFLNVSGLERPFDYKLRLNGNGDGEDVAVDLPETFNYLLGLAVRTRRVYDDDGRRYLVYTGRTRDKREAVVIWRNTAGWTAEDRERDRDFVAANGITADADEIWVNSDSMVKDSRSLDGLFKKRMFAPTPG